MFSRDHFDLVATAIGVLAVLLQGCASSTKQTSFSSPDAATQALVNAIRIGDQPQLERVLGPDSQEVLYSGDPVADQQRLERFLFAYDQEHRLVAAGDGSVTLLLGKREWPMPIPIVQERSKWVFDTAAGKQEILNRRIGRNELDAIQVCQAICDAQRDYAERNPQGGNSGLHLYARRIVSDPGTKDGLYWPTEEGQELSPLGPLVAQATAQGYSTQASGESGPRPYHGYFYRILTQQGKDAPGGEMDYIVDGKLLGGFAVVAWPASYGNSGIMTFIVNHSGVVYQKDLGDDTDQLARAMTSYNPDTTWTVAQAEGATRAAFLPAAGPGPE